MDFAAGAGVRVTLCDVGAWCCPRWWFLGFQSKPVLNSKGNQPHATAKTICLLSLALYLIPQRPCVDTKC